MDLEHQREITAIQAAGKEVKFQDQGNMIKRLLLDLKLMEQF